ncbi:CAAD domain-containing protein [Synechococcus sp. MIT S9508]|uniref:CAAD domain-containing protein n=1 Tax=Synechococcus sp. MIT S9508 TaxID=1801629 RepID=UPI0007BBBEE4|nr:CAAD domain-containing protein [Synechococcus sp. MIT S9508]KZR88199.1 hypothetical protein MITS9508_02342 [Synechococcus sp. MIT S9508]
MSSDKPSEKQAPAESINPDLSAQGDITDRGVEQEPIPAVETTAAEATAVEKTAAEATAVEKTAAETPVTPEPAAQPVTAPASPSIAERISVPAQASADSSEEDGGEWDLLSNRIKQFFEANNLQDQWQSLRQPLFLLGGLIVVILTMRIYGGILDAIATVPLAPRLFQLVGTFYAVWFAATRLIRAEERKKISANVNDLWTSLRGGSKS